MDPWHQPGIRISLVKILCVLLAICVVGFLGVIYWINHKNAIKSKSTSTSIKQQTGISTSITSNTSQSYTTMPIELSNKAVNQAGIYYTLIGRVNDISLTDSKTKEYQFTIYDSSGTILPITFIFRDDPRLIKITKIENHEEKTATAADIKNNSPIQFSWNINLLKNESAQIANIVIEQ